MKQVRNSLGLGETSATATATTPDSSVMAVVAEHRRPIVKSGTYIARLVTTIESSLIKLGVKLDKDPEEYSRRIEQMAVIIHDSMSASTRNYHSVQHVFDVAEGVADDPIAVLAALFHDAVYYHVDGGISDLQREHLQIFEDAFAPSSSSSDGKAPEYRVKGDSSSGSSSSSSGNNNDSDVVLRMVESIFGYPLNTVVTHQNGLNEFLSAVICARKLHGILPLTILAQLACCIEATIPFRPVTEDQYGYQMSCSDRLFMQMRVTNSKFDLELQEDELVKAVQRAVRVANEDVANFGTGDVLWFLDNTWSLLPETNEALRQQFLYSVENFQFAIFKMYGFFSFLQPDLVFQHFKGVPSPKVLAERRNFAAINLALGRKYVGAKLLSLSVLAAFAELSGGDAPISLFMGDLPMRHPNGNVPPCPLAGLPKPPIDVKRDATVYQILAEGRRSETAFDIRQSPLAAYLYGHLGDEKVNALLKKPHPQWDALYPMTKKTATALLKELPRESVRLLGSALAIVAVSRKEALEDAIKNITED